MIASSQNHVVIPKPGGALLRIWIQPGSRSTEVLGLYDGCLKIKVASPPVEGKANQALCQFVAKTLGLSKGRVRLVSGATSRRKVLFVFCSV